MMKFTAAATLLSVLHQQTTCHASTLRGNSEGEESRKLQAYDADGAMSSPLNDYDMGITRRYPGSTEFLQPTHEEDGYVCYNEIFATVSGGPSTADFIVMFNENFVYHGNDHGIYAAPPQGYYPSYFTRRGLYDVTDGPGSCVMFGLLYEDPDIGQIVASSQFDPIKIIGITGTIIYGYYVHNGVWKREKTKWGDAQDGSLTVALDGGSTSGVAANGDMFHLYGKFDPDSSNPSDRNFNWAPQRDIQCASKPAIIGDWSGRYAVYRGTYCPGADNNQLRKFTWHSSGSAQEELSWKAGEKIARLGPKSAIVGISTGGRLLKLWNNGGTIRSASVTLPGLTNVRALGGGVDDKYARGVFALTVGDDLGDMPNVYNVYWDGGWKIKEIYLYVEVERRGGFLLFGNFRGKTYALYQEMTPMCADGSGRQIVRFDYVGGSERYRAVPISSHRRRLC